MKGICLLLCFSIFCACQSNDTAEKQVRPVLSTKNILENLEYREQKHLRQSIDSLLPILTTTCKKFSLNENWVLIANLGIHSGLPRMVVWNIQEKRVVDSGLVAHGYGEATFAENVVFSNTSKSYCSSKGIFRIGAKYKGSFGWSYKLHGLEMTNNNAFERFIVLHPYECVPSSSIYPSFCCNSQGCPMVNPDFMKRLEKMIDNSKRPMMLWIIG